MQREKSSREPRSNIHQQSARAVEAAEVRESAAGVRTQIVAQVRNGFHLAWEELRDSARLLLQTAGA